MPRSNDSNGLSEIADSPVDLTYHKSRSILKYFTVRTSTGYMSLKRGDVVVIQDNYKDLTSLFIALRRALLRNGPAVVVFGFCGRWPAGKAEPSLSSTVLNRIRSIGVDHYATYTPLGVEALLKAGVDPAKISLLNNCGNSDALLEGFATTNASSLSRSNSVVFVGRLLEAKGAYLLPEIGRLLAKRGWHLEVVGDGPLKPAIIEAANEGSITYHGAIHDDHELAKVLARSDTLLTLGRAGLSVVDGLLLGLRVVAAGTSLVKQSPEIWYARNIGTEVSSIDVTEIVSVLTEGNKGEPKTQALATARFSSEAMAASYLEAISTAAC